MKEIRIGTRRSKLALLQTKIVCEAIKKFDESIDIKVVPMSTKGDEIQDISLLKLGGKGVFTKELEEALLLGKIDMAVHSAKDIPLELPEGLCISPVLKREDPSDVVISLTGEKLRDFPPGKTVGTSSLRRQLQAKKINNNIEIKDLRGNIQTRIKKLKSGEYDAIILAGAGIKRLEAYSENKDFEDLYFEYMNPKEFLPASGQGILAIEHREGDFAQLIKSLDCENTSKAFLVEREFLLSTGAGCNAPCGIYCDFKDDICEIDLMYADRNLNLRYEHITEGFEKARNEARRLAVVLKETF